MSVCLDLSQAYLAISVSLGLCPGLCQAYLPMSVCLGLCPGLCQAYLAISVSLGLCPGLCQTYLAISVSLGLCPGLCQTYLAMSVSLGLCPGLSQAHVPICGPISPSPTAGRHKPHSVAYSWGGIAAYHRGLRPDGLLDRPAVLASTSKKPSPNQTVRGRRRMYNETLWWSYWPTYLSKVLRTAPGPATSSVKYRITRGASPAS